MKTWLCIVHEKSNTNLIFIGYNEQFNVNYNIFQKYDQKIVNNMRNLAKKRSVDKGIVCRYFQKNIGMNFFHRKKLNINYLIYRRFLY